MFSCYFRLLDLFQAKLDFNFQFRTHFPSKLVKGICQTLHFIHCTAEACFRPKRTNLVEETDCFLSVAHHWSLMMTCIPLRLNPTAFSVKPRLLNFFLSRSQWVRAHGDWGWVIVTVPALGCPVVSRWDLTRHGLSSLPYSPDTGEPSGQGCYEGRGNLWLLIFFVSSKHLSRQLWIALSPTNNLHCFTVLLKRLLWIHIFWKQFTVNSVKGLSTWKVVFGFFSELYIISRAMVFYSSLWDS